MRCVSLGASLAQDRGRLEAKIEVLSTELETQKKQNERDTDALKIKAKIIDDQTESIRKLKEVFHRRETIFLLYYFSFIDNEVSDFPQT